MFENLKFFGKAFKKVKTNNQMDLFITLGTEKEFGHGDKRKLQLTSTGKKRWMDADEKKKVAKEKKPIITGKVQLLKNSDNYNIREINNQRFMYNPKTEEMILGTNDVSSSSHAQEHHQSGAKGGYDDFYRGWIGYDNKKYKDGVIHFAPEIDKDIFAKDEEYAGGALKTIEMFTKHGANKKTILRNFVKRGEQLLSDNFDHFPQAGKMVKQPYEKTLAELEQERLIDEIAKMSYDKDSGERTSYVGRGLTEKSAQIEKNKRGKEFLIEKDELQSGKFKVGHKVKGDADGLTFDEYKLKYLKDFETTAKNNIEYGITSLKELKEKFPDSDIVNTIDKPTEKQPYEMRKNELTSKDKKGQPDFTKPNPMIKGQSIPFYVVNKEPKFYGYTVKESKIVFDNKFNGYRISILENNNDKEIIYGVEKENDLEGNFNKVEVRFENAEGDNYPDKIAQEAYKYLQKYQASNSNDLFNETKKSMSTIKIFGKELQPESLSYRSIKLLKAFGKQLGLFNERPYSREGHTKEGKGGTLQLKRDNTGKGAHWQLMDKKQSQSKTPGQQQQNLPGQSGMQEQGMKLINMDKAYNILSNKLGASLSINDKAGSQIDNGSLQLINVNNDNTISLFYKDKNGSTQIVNAPTNQAVSQSDNSVDLHFADRDISIELKKQQNIATGQEVENKLPSEQAEESSKVAEANRKVDQLLKEASTQRDGFLADLDIIAKDNGLDPHSAEFRRVSLKSKDEFVKDYLDDDGFVNDMLQGAIVADSMDKYTSVVSGLKNKGYEIINEDELKNSDTMNYKSIKVKRGKEDEVVKEVVVANEAMYSAMLNSKAGPNYHRETLYSLDYKVEAEKIPELKAIKDKIYAGTTPGKKEIIITGGLAGSGKSTAIEKRHYKNKVYIDPDDIKNKLYADERGISKDDIRKNPAKYHEESSVLGKHLIREAIRDGRDAFYDATMKGAQNIEDLIKFAKSNGYKVKAKFVHIRLEEGIKRDKGRGEAGERSLGENLYRKLYDGYPTHKVFFSLQDKFDHAELIDNSQPKGEKPKIIQRVNNGKVTIEKKKELREVKSLAGLLKALRIMLFKAQMNINTNSMFDNSVKDDYITDAKQKGLENMKEETMKNEGMEEKIDPRLFTLLEIEDDGNFDADENSFMLGMLEENGLITHDLKLTPEGEKAYEKEIAELGSEDED